MPVIDTMFRDKAEANGVFWAENLLTWRHIPDEPVGREDELRRMVDALHPISRRREPTNLLIHGPAGVGKSLCVSHVFDRLADETSVETVRINCWQYNTRPSFLTQLPILIGFPAPRKGKPVDELLSRLREWLDKNSRLVVGLEEFDQLREQTEIVYDLQHVSHRAENPVGLVLVSNTHPSNIELDPRSESRLSVRTLEFRPYSAEGLYNILEARVEEACHPDAVPAEALEYVAEVVAESSGDCREAMDLLLQAGRLAEFQKADTIDRSHVEAVM